MLYRWKIQFTYVPSDGQPGSDFKIYVAPSAQDAAFIHNTMRAADMRKMPYMFEGRSCDYGLIERIECVGEVK